MSKFKFLKTKFNTMWKNFPKGRIGGDCAKYDHQCAIRMSEALRKSGIPLNTYSDRVCKVGKDPHARGAQALASWLWRHHFGRPQIFTDAREALKKLKSQQGIIFFKDCFQRKNETWEKRTGDHIDLYNKGKLKGYNGFDTAKEIWFFPSTQERESQKQSLNPIDFPQEGGNLLSSLGRLLDGDTSIDFDKHSSNNPGDWWKLGGVDGDPNTPW